MTRSIIALFAAVVLLSPAGPALAEPAWSAEGLIRPGVQTRSDSGQCTSNFIFYEPLAGGAYDVFIGSAAHCFGNGSITQSNGCTTSSRPLGSRATIQGAAFAGTLAYSSWITMNSVGETDPNACATNDFALVKLDPRDHANVNPTLRFFGGPEGMRATKTTTGDEVFSYGNSGLRLGLTRLSPKRGISSGTIQDGWTHRVYAVTPGIPGDSGSAVIDANGAALGVLVTIRGDGSNGATDLNKMLTYLRAETGRDIRLASGLEPFQDRLA